MDRDDEIEIASRLFGRRDALIFMWAVVAVYGAVLTLWAVAMWKLAGYLFG